MQQSFRNRLAAIERLERKWHIEARPVEEWTDQELLDYLQEAYRIWPRLRTMSDDALEALYVKAFS